MVNEFFIIIMLYHLLVFNDFNSPQRSKNLVGYSMMGVMLLNMLFNFLLIIGSCLKELCKTLRTKYYKWRHKKLLKRL
jgi:hypothetical protein